MALRSALSARQGSGSVVADTRGPMIKRGPADVARFAAAKAGLVKPGEMMAGPYAREAGDIVGTTGLNRVGATQAVTPLGERLTANVAGTAITGFLAAKAMDGSITGNGPVDPDELAMLKAKGWQAHSVFVPGLGYVET